MIKRFLCHGDSYDIIITLHDFDSKVKQGGTPRLLICKEYYYLMKVVLGKELIPVVLIQVRHISVPMI